MNIVLFKSDKRIYKEVLEAIKEENVEVYEIEKGNSDNEFLAELLEVNKRMPLTAIMSLDYIPFLSLASGALGIKYISWIIEGYNPSQFDATITNSWNYLFLANEKYIDYYKHIGINNCYFLPLAAEKRYIDSDYIMERSEEKAISIWSEAIYERTSIVESLRGKKDSTIGYIDGVIEARKAFCSIDPFYDRFPDYVKNDIEDCGNNKTQVNETNGIYFDNNYIAQYMDRICAFTYFGKIQLANVIDKLYVVSKHNFIFQDEGRETIQIQDDKYAAYNKICSTISIYIPKTTDGNLITCDIWNTMALGGIVLFPKFISKELLNRLGMPSFIKAYDVERIVREYYGDEARRKEMRMLLRQRIRENETFNNRIQLLIDIVKG